MIVKSNELEICTVYEEVMVCFDQLQVLKIINKVAKTSKDDYVLEAQSRDGTVRAGHRAGMSR